MLITKRNFDAFLSDFTKNVGKFRALDTETTGIWWWKSPHVPWYTPRVFSIQLSGENTPDYYLDFNHSADKLGDAEMQRLQREVFDDPEAYWFDQNVKFEMHHLANHGLELKGTLHCTKAIARVVNNLEPSLKLDDLGAKYLGQPKLDVISIIKEKGLSTPVKKWGRNGKSEDWLHFDRLPLETLVEYGGLDTRICLKLGLLQLAEVRKQEEQFYSGCLMKLSDVVANENALSRPMFKMERVGVQLDIPYCERAYEFECGEYERLDREMRAMVAEKYSESPDWLSTHSIKAIFAALGEKSYKVTEKGAMSFDKEALEQMAHPLAAHILQYRYHYMRAHTYFENFVWLADAQGVLHCDLQPAGADTGRMSCWAPNLQNVPKRKDKDEANFKVRRCFVPRPGKFFADLDYQAAEYRMMIDYAREHVLAEAIKGGADVHVATKELLEIESRDDAKNMGFGLLYGMGDRSLARRLGVKEFRAKQLKKLYFDRLPNVANFLTRVKEVASTRGYVINWLGRRLQYVTGGYPHGTSFKAPNGLIQGGIGDTLKRAMVKLEELDWRNSSPLLPIHDAILCEIDENDRHLVEEIKRVMASAYPEKILPMEVDAGFSRKSWSDLTDELPPVA